jgi:histidinol phosphatase-like enzyme (inositol monophosphatase family)
MISTSETAIDNRLELAREIARDAGQLTLRYFADELVVDWKVDRSPVTVADREAELFLRKKISERFANDAILGEEFGETAGDSGFRWILDPIDGTKSFISGVPLYGTLIGIEFQGQCVVGVIELPALDRRISAAAHQDALWQTGDGPLRRATVSSCPRLSEGLYVTSEIKTFQARDAAVVHARLEAASWISRTWGDCYG